MSEFEYTCETVLKCEYMGETFLINKKQQCPNVIYFEFAIAKPDERCDCPVGCYDNFNIALNKMTDYIKEMNWKKGCYQWKT